MKSYEILLAEAEENNIEIIEDIEFHGNLKALYIDSTIGLSKGIETQMEKKCILAEELGHYYTSTGDIINQNDQSNRKQELKARCWSYEKLLPLASIIDAYLNRCQNIFDLSEFLDLPVSFLENALAFYKNKYGLYVIVDPYVICFDPLKIKKVKGVKDE